VPVIVNNRIEYRDVEVGINNKVYAQILSGLNEGDQIMLGQSSTNDGAATKSDSSRGNKLGQRTPGLGKEMRL
jgi:macrolide-specific efflux system membrane fusion protein